MLVKVLILYLTIINITALIMYGTDKRRAIKKKWRIPEKYLIGVAIAGGSVGAIAGMYLFRHKTKHFKFTFGVPLVLIIQVIIFALVLKARLLPVL